MSRDPILHETPHQLPQAVVGSASISDAQQFKLNFALNGLQSAKLSEILVICGINATF